MISRDHAEICGEKSPQGLVDRYYIDDRSLNGTYINDIRLNGKTEIRNGDVIKFGHMNGAAVKRGEKAPQVRRSYFFVNIVSLGFDMC